MKYRKITGVYNGRKYDVDIAIEEAYSLIGLQQCGWHIVAAEIDGIRHNSRSKKADFEELHEFVSLNISEE